MKTLNENECSQKVSEELDLLKIISIFWHWCIKYIWRPFLEIIRMIIRRWYVFLVAILLGLALAYFYPQSQSNDFYASMQFKTNSVSPADYVNKLSILGKQNSKYWKDTLKLSDEAAKNLLAICPHYVCYNNTDKTSFSVDYFDVNYTDLLHPIVNHLFCLEIKTTSNEYLGEYTEAFYQYLKTDKYLSLLSNQEIYRNESRLKFIEKELITIDNLRQQQNATALNLSTRFSDKDFLAEYNDPVAYHELLSSLKDQAIGIELFLKEKDTPLKVISPIKPRYDVVNTNLPSTSQILISFFLIALVITFLIDYRKEIASFSKKHLSK